MKKQKENSYEGITWSEMGKQNVQAKEVYLICNFNCFPTVRPTSTAVTPLVKLPSLCCVLVWKEYIFLCFQSAYSFSKYIRGGVDAKSTLVG